MFTKYGYATIGFVSVLSFVLVIVSQFTIGIISTGLIILVILILAFTLNFFRDPERKTPVKENILVSPADGKVLVIKDVDCDRFINGRAKQISIFMSPLNVHVNRIPVSGKVEYLKYVKGRFLKAYADKADLENERMEIGITTNNSKVFYTQVAGFVARRIICDLKENQEVRIGERFGMIKFGSRVDVIVPPEWKVVVSEGMNVTAGETILFELNT